MLHLLLECSKELLSKNELITFDSEEGIKYFFFETQHLYQPKQLFEAIKRIFRKEYTPVLAHPERYNYLQRDRILIHQLYETVLLFQVNINSFSGYYGTESRELAEYLSVDQMIRFLVRIVINKNKLRFYKKTMHSPIYYDCAE